MSRSAPRRPGPEAHARGTGRARLPKALLVLFLGVWVALAIAPSHRQDWLLENVLVLVAVPVLAWSHRRVPLSDAVYASLFAFGVLHEVGAHYTYSQVPYDRWLESLAGSSPQAWFDLGRNHYDRAIHFAYGLLVTPAAIELIEARAAPKGAWRWLLPVSFVASHSLLYELIEWAAALVFGGELGEAYLGTQGDAWDAQKDMLLALAGSMLAATLLLALRRPRSRD